MTFDYMVCLYAIYVLLSLALTIWVAQTLHKNGRSFLMRAFKGNADLADSVNHLLKVGFYLFNVGYVSLALTEHAEVIATQQLIEVLSLKIGGVLMLLGVMHFFNLFIFSLVAASSKKEPAPVQAGPDDKPFVFAPHQS